jgi:hypothetical protein
MVDIAVRAFPPGISPETLGQWLDETRSREALVRQMIGQFEKRYSGSLEALEARLARGEGPEHPDWEDSIEWRNAIETLHRTRLMKGLLEWLLRSIAPLPTL